MAVEILRCLYYWFSENNIALYQMLQEHSFCVVSWGQSCLCLVFVHTLASPQPQHFTEDFWLYLQWVPAQLLLLCLHCFSWLIWALCTLWLPWITCWEMHFSECAGKPPGFTRWGTWWLMYLVLDTWDIEMICRDRHLRSLWVHMHWCLGWIRRVVLVCTSHSSLLATLLFALWSNLGVHKLNSCWMKLKTKQCFRIDTYVPQPVMGIQSTGSD